MFAGIATWFAAKAIPWKLIGIGAVALLILAAVFAGYIYVKSLQSDLLDVTKKYEKEALKRAIAEESYEEYKNQHQSMISEMTKLNKANVVTEDKWSVSFDDIDKLKVIDTNEQTVSELNRLSTSTRRMLESSSSRR